MSQELKKGDIIYCHNSCIMDDYEKISTTTINKSYEIIDISEYDFKIIDDQNESHFFSLYENDESYYKQWFNSDRIIRKNKLEKINTDLKMKRILLDQEDFEKLTAGKVIEKDNVQIALSDIGYFNMAEIIRDNYINQDKDNE